MSTDHIARIEEHDVKVTDITLDYLITEEKVISPIERSDYPISIFGLNYQKLSKDINKEEVETLFIKQGILTYDKLPEVTLINLNQIGLLDNNPNELYKDIKLLIQQMNQNIEEDEKRQKKLSKKWLQQFDINKEKYDLSQYSNKKSLLSMKLLEFRVSYKTRKLKKLFDSEKFKNAIENDQNYYLKLVDIIRLNQSFIDQVLFKDKNINFDYKSIGIELKNNSSIQDLKKHLSSIYYVLHHYRMILKDLLNHAKKVKTKRLIDLFQINLEGFKKSLLNEAYQENYLFSYQYNLGFFYDLVIESIIFKANEVFDHNLKVIDRNKKLKKKLPVISLVAISLILIFNLLINFSNINTDLSNFINGNKFFFAIQLIILSIYISVFYFRKKDNSTTLKIKITFDILYSLLFFVIIKLFSPTVFMSNEQIITFINNLFNLGFENSILIYFMNPNSVNTVSPLINNIARLILYLSGFIILKPLIFKLNKKTINKIESKLLANHQNKKSEESLKRTNKHNFLNIFRGVFNAYVLLLPLGVLMTTVEPLTFNQKIELTSIDNKSSNEISLITKSNQEIVLDQQFVSFVNDVNDFNIVNIHNWFSFISEPIFDFIFEEKMNDNYIFNIRKELINTAVGMENLIQAGLFNKNFSVEELDARDVEFISDSVLVLSESDLVLEVIESSIYVLQNGLLDEITNLNNINSEYTVEGFQNLNNINWKQELIAISQIVSNFENFERFDILENTLADPMYIFEFSDKDIKIITDSIRDISSLEIIKSTNIVLDYLISSDIPLSILTWLDEENAKEYLEVQLKEILEDPNYFYGPEGEIDKIIDLLDLILIGNGITKFKEYIDDEFSLDLLLTNKTNLYLDELLADLFEIQLITPIISMAVDNYLFENFEPEDAEVILERLEMNFNSFSIQNEISTIDDVFMALIKINIPGYLDSDQETIDIIEEIISDHIEDVKDISFSVFKDSKAIAGLINSLTPELIYHFVPDVELATIMVETFFVEDQLVIDLAEELELILDVINEINEINSITTFTNLEGEEIIPFLENFVSNDLSKYKRFSTILLDESKIISNLLEVSPVKTIDFFISDELTREFLKKAFIVDGKINVDIDQEINHLIDNIVLLHEIVSIGDLENLVNEGNYIEFVDDLFVNHMEELKQVVNEIFEQNNIIKSIFEKAPEEFINLTITDEKVKNYLLDFFQVNDQQVVISQKIIETVESISILYSFSNIQEINESIQEESFNVYIKEKLTENKGEIVEILKTFEIISDSTDVETLIDLYTESTTYNQFFISLIEENKETFINVSREVLKSDLVKNSIDNSAESLFDLFIPDEELRSLLIGALTSEGKLNFELIDELENIVFLLSDVHTLIPLDELLSGNTINLNNTGQTNLNSISQSLDITFLLNNREAIESILKQFFELNSVKGMLQSAPQEFIEFISPDEKVESLLKVTLLNEDGDIEINLFDNILDSIDILVDINDLVPFKSFQQNLSFDLINSEFRTIEKILTRILSNELLDSLINNATYELIDFIVSDTKLRELLFGIFLDENNQLDIDLNNEIYELIDIIKFTNETIPLDDLFNDLRRSSQIIPILELLTNDYKTITKMVINRFFNLDIVQKTINIAYDEFLEVIVDNENIKTILSETYGVVSNKADTIKQDLLYFVDILELVNETLGLQFFENALRNGASIESTLSTLLFENKATTKFLIRSLFDTHIISEVTNSHLVVLIDELVVDLTINEALKTVFVENSSASTIENDLLDIIDIIEFIWSSLNSSQLSQVNLNNYNNIFNQIVYLISIRESSLKTSINALFETNIIKQVLKLDIVDLAIFFGADRELVDFIDDVFYNDGVMVDVQKNLIDLVNVSIYYNQYLIDVIALGDLVIILDNFDHIYEFVLRLESIQIVNNLLISDLTFILNTLDVNEDFESLIRIFLTNENQLKISISKEVENLNKIIETSGTIFDFEVLLDNIYDLDTEKLINLGYTFGSLTQEEFNTLNTAFKDLQILELLDKENTESLLTFLGVENVYIPASFDAALEVEFLFNLVYGLSVYLHENMEPGLTPIEDVDFTELLLSDTFADLLLVKEGTLNSQLLVPNLAYSIESALIEVGLDETIIVPEVLLASSPESEAWVVEYNVLVTLFLTVAELAADYYDFSVYGFDELVLDFKFKTSDQDEFVEVLGYIDELVLSNLEELKQVVGDIVANSQILVATADHTLNTFVEPILGTEVSINVIQEILTLLNVVEVGYDVFSIHEFYTILNNNVDIFEALVQLGIEFGSLETNRFEELKSGLLSLQLISLLNYDTSNKLFNYLDINLIIHEEIIVNSELSDALDLVYLTSDYLNKNYILNQTDLKTFDFSELITSDSVYEILITDNQVPSLLSVNFAYYLVDILEFNDLDFLVIPDILSSTEIDSEVWTNEYIAWINIIRALFNELETEYSFSNQGLSEMLKDIVTTEFSWLEIIGNLQDESGKLLFNSLIDESLILSQDLS